MKNHKCKEFVVLGEDKKEPVYQWIERVVCKECLRAPTHEEIIAALCKSAQFEAEMKQVVITNMNEHSKVVITDCLLS